MIYCVEDDDNIRELVIYTLETTGLKAKGFADGAAFMEALAFDTPELILLDIMLPGDDGMVLLKKLKSSSKTKDIPVIMVTAKGSEYDKVIGLDSGADDYVTKPFGMMELVSRIKAVLRRSRKTEEKSQIELSGVCMNIKKHDVTVNGKEVALTLKEFELLEKLMLNKGIVLTRDQLLTEIWGYDFDGETRTVDVHVRTLRQKLPPEHRPARPAVAADRARRPEKDRPYGARIQPQRRISLAARETGRLLRTVPDQALARRHHRHDGRFRATKCLSMN